MSVTGYVCGSSKGSSPFSIMQHFQQELGHKAKPRGKRQAGWPVLYPAQLGSRLEPPEGKGSSLPYPRVGASCPNEFLGSVPAN